MFPLALFFLAFFALGSSKPQQGFGTGPTAVFTPSPATHHPHGSSGQPGQGSTATESEPASTEPSTSNETTPLPGNTGVPAAVNDTSVPGAITGIPGGANGTAAPEASNGTTTLPGGTAGPGTENGNGTAAPELTNGNGTSGLPGTTPGAPPASNVEESTPNGNTTGLPVIDAPVATEKPLGNASESGLDAAAAAAAAAAGGGRHGLICVCKSVAADPPGTYDCRCSPTTSEALIQPQPSPGPVPNDTNINVPVEQPTPEVQNMTTPRIGQNVSTPAPGPGGNETTEETQTPGTPGTRGPEGPETPAPAGNQTTPEPTKPGPSTPEPPGDDILPPNGTPKPGNKKTFVVCTRLDQGNPTSDYLTDSQGKSVAVEGQWMAYQCKGGLSEPFQIDKITYDDLLRQCQAKGYDHPQPSDDQHLSSYPFQYDNFITEYYRHRTPFMFNHIPKTPLDRCVDVRKLRGRAH